MVPLEPPAEAEAEAEAEADALSAVVSPALALSPLVLVSVVAGVSSSPHAPRRAAVVKMVKSDRFIMVG